MLKAGYKLHEVEVMTLKDVLLVMQAERQKQEEKWDIARHLMATVMNFSGIGTRDPVSPLDIMALAMDEEDRITPITSIEEALELIENM